MNSLRMLSWNVQMRSWAMQVGASPGYTIPPIDTAEERAKIIAQKLVASAFDYDVVGLSEVFDEDAREVLVDELRAHFPFIISTCDYNYLATESAGAEVDLPLLATWKLVGIPDDISSNYRLEDSGLMVFSRFPFDTMSTASLGPGLAEACALLGYPLPATMPVVNFLPYVDTDGNDGDACKGIVYARVRRDQFSEPVHVFFSHTQADTDVVEEHRTARAKQIQVAADFIKVCAGGFPLPEETFYMGDLNIMGEPLSTAVSIAEWSSYFATPGHAFTDVAVDLWGARQCVGAPGLRDPGYSASVRYPPQEQRLDYVLGSVTSGLSAQHLSIDYDLSEVPPGHPDVSYMSDHKPLRIDLARPVAHSTPAGAMVPVFPAFPSFPVVTDGPVLLTEGQVRWYRFDEAGTYDFRLDEGADRCGFEVYLDTDLSRPRKQYREEENPDTGKKFVLASAPFVVKVFPFSRGGEQNMSFRAYKHNGVGPWDAIQLPYGVPVSAAFPGAGQRLNDDMFSTPWDDADTKWFRLDGPQVDIGRKVTAEVAITGSGVTFGVSLARENAGTWTLEDQQGPGESAYVLKVELGKGDVAYVQVTRADGLAPGDLSVELLAKVDISLLLGGARGEPRVVCEKETSGWGADDIEMSVNVDGALLRRIDNDEIGDFDQDDVREIRQYLPDLIPYTKGVQFVISELDDTSPNDIGRSTLPPADEVLLVGTFVPSPPPQPRPDGTVRGVLHVSVDDGVYAVQVTVATWDETF